MFANIFKVLKERLNESKLNFIFKRTALGQLLTKDTPPSAQELLEAYSSSWWWNRLWFRSRIQKPDEASKFDELLKAKIFLQREKVLDGDSFNTLANLTKEKFDIVLSSIKKSKLTS